MASAAGPTSPASSNHSFAFSISPSFLVEFKASSSMADLKDALRKYLEQVQPIIASAKEIGETMPLLTKFCEELGKYLEEDSAGKDPHKELRDWMEKVGQVRENEEGISAFDIPAIVLKY